MTTTPVEIKGASRKPGFEHIHEHFKDPRALWSLTSPRKEFPNAFSITAYRINGRPVLLQEFGEEMGNSWDVYVQASQSGEIAETISDLKKQLGLGEETNAADEIAFAIASLQRATQRLARDGVEFSETRQILELAVAALRGRIEWGAEGWQAKS